MSYCKKCGVLYSGDICPKCGAMQEPCEEPPAPAPVTKRERNLSWLFLVIGIPALISAAYGLVSLVKYLAH